MGLFCAGPVIGISNCGRRSLRLSCVVWRGRSLSAVVAGAVGWRSRPETGLPATAAESFGEAVVAALSRAENGGSA